MNVIVVDTSSWISYLAGRENKDIDLALREGRVFLAPVVVAELLSAQLSPTEKDQLVDFLLELPLCDASFAHWIRVGELRADLARKGITISTPDAHVAQCCLDLDGYLLSDDRVFESVHSVRSLRILER